MAGQTMKVASGTGGAFDLYLALPAGAAYSQTTREFSMARALVILDGLRGGGSTMRKAS